MLAIGIAITPWFAATSWADNFNLESVDFTSSGDRTNIVLHTGSIVPVQKILSSDTKLILEIEQVNTDETVRTNFAGATNISHVIMQPINEHKVRMIIRGENLAPPSVAFFNPSNGEASSSNPNFESQGSLFKTKPNPITQEKLPDPLPKAVANTESKLQAKATHEPIQALPTDSIADNESIPFGGLGTDSKPVTLAEPIAVKATPPATPEKMKPLSLPALEMPPASNEWLEQAKTGRYNNYILGALLALVALGVGGLIVRKIIQLKQVEPDLEELLQEQYNGKKVSFKEMANAYRNKHDQQPKTENFTSKPGGKKQHAEDVIGLRSLNHLEPDEAPSVQQPAPKTPPMQQKPAAPKAPAGLPPIDPFGGKTPSMEQLVSLLQAVSEPKPQAPIKTPAPQKQVINQYKQAEKPKEPATKPALNNPVRRAAQQDETLIKETKRAQTLQQDLMRQAQQQIVDAQAQKLPQKSAPVNRAMAAKKTVQPANFKTAPATNPVNPKSRATTANSAAMGKNGPLPGNPEVLNFLRNVADLMEKDGKPQIANSIHKNLNPKI